MLWVFVPLVCAKWAMLKILYVIFVDCDLVFAYVMADSFFLILGLYNEAK